MQAAQSDAGGVRHEAAQHHHQASLLCQRDEAVRRHHFPIGTTPTQQGLEPQHARGLEAHLGLVDRNELAGAGGGAQAVEQLHAGAGFLAHLGREVAGRAAPLALGALEREVRVLEQVGAAIGVFVQPHQAHRGRQAHRLLLDHEGHGEQVLQALGSHLVGRAQHAEHVGAQSGQAAGSAGLLSQAVRHSTQHRVTEAMAQHVVDVGKAIDVQHGQRRGGVSRGCAAQRLQHLVEVGDVQQRIHIGLVHQLTVQQHVLEASGHARAEHLDKVAIERQQGRGVVHVSRQAPPVRCGEIQGQAVVKVAVAFIQAALQGGLHTGQAQLAQGALDEVAITPGCRDHARGLALPLQACLRTDQAFRLDAQQRAQLADHALCEQVHAVQLAQVGAGAHHHLQAPTRLLVRAHLAVDANGHRQAGEKPHPRQLRLGAVVVDVVVTDGVELGRVARLTGAQDDAQRFALERVAHVVHELEPGVVRLHHHIQQDDGQVLVLRHHSHGFLPRVGVQQLHGPALDAQVAQRHLGGAVHVGIVVDDEHLPGRHRRCGRCAVAIVLDEGNEFVVARVVRR